MERELKISHANPNLEQVYLVGVRLLEGSATPDYFSLVLYYEAARNDGNRPLVHQGKIVFFKHAGAADRVLRLGDVAFRKYAPFKGELSIKYDVPEVLRLIRDGDRDAGGIIVTFLNELLDFLAASKDSPSEDARLLLAGLADHVTFHQDLDDYFGMRRGLRRETLDAILWAIGSVVASSAVID